LGLTNVKPARWSVLASAAEEELSIEVRSFPGAMGSFLELSVF